MNDLLSDSKNHPELGVFNLATMLIKNVSLQIFQSEKNGAAT